MPELKYSHTYTAEDVKELLGWFEAHASVLPKSLRLGKEINIPDVPTAVTAFSELIKAHGTEHHFSGHVFTLQRIRAAIERQLAEADKEVD